MEDYIDKEVTEQGFNGRFGADTPRTSDGLFATSFYHKMRKSLGSKRNEISRSDIAEITRIYGEFKENKYCKIFDNKEFGYLKVTIERPLQLNFKLSEDRIENLYSDIKLNNSLFKAILMGLSERDETADYCYSGKKKEADSNPKGYGEYTSIYYCRWP